MSYRMNCEVVSRGVCEVVSREIAKYELASDMVGVVLSEMMLLRATTNAALLVLGIAITISSADDNDTKTANSDRIFGRRLSSNERKRVVISIKQSNSDNGLVRRDTTHLRASVLKQKQYHDHHYNRRRLSEVVYVEEEEEKENSSFMMKSEDASEVARRSLQYIPGDDPTQDDDLIWDPSYRYPELEAIIETELSLSMMQLSLSPTPSLLPHVTSPAPTPCEYRKWYLSYTKRPSDGAIMGAIMVCTNGEYSSSIIGSMIYYDSVDDCCAQKNTMLDDEDGDECMKIDVCSPN